MRKGFVTLICAAAVFTSVSCSSEIAEEQAQESGSGELQENTADSVTGTVSVAEEPEEEEQILQFVDVFGEQYETVILASVEKHPYDWEKLTRDESWIYYEDDTYISRMGIDVSYHQGEIDWEAVKNAGVSFAFIRIGYRGYGEAGIIREDTKALENIREAQAEGIDVGVYFFSQAVNEEEAAEEAEFVIEKLEGIDLQLPVVYDPESILDDEARTDNVSGKQFTENTLVFCDRIREAGYEPMIYSNMLWEAFEFDLEELSDLEIWYADYEQIPQTPYHFTFWQFENEGTVDGVDGNVDLNIQIYEKGSGG